MSQALVTHDEDAYGTEQRQNQTSKSDSKSSTLGEVDKTYGVLMVMDIMAGTMEAKATAVVKDFMSLIYWRENSTKAQIIYCVKVEGRRDELWGKPANLLSYIVVIFNVRRIRDRNGYKGEKFSTCYERLLQSDNWKQGPCCQLSDQKERQTASKSCVDSSFSPDIVVLHRSIHMELGVSLVILARMVIGVPSYLGDITVP